ncbi:hypothetical protein [Corynebacterium aquatimens]|uniref:Thioester domain-containing protein n=1 Tax=Corynebacterium aquatimens TaxID=1190508 RepID=A0A931E4V7_9CORY|nr:hypothetical protein [Corynebacterium aquatimens]MBG6122493.1 hypothetical protein [Corynebacterium aquatimens]WJY64967.1 hypothetical protein CAQUA_01140 [Corynebacterium aquatimens]
MKRTPRIAALATALATSVTGANVAYAAQVGPREGDHCVIEFSTEERTAYLWGILQEERLLDSGHSALARGYEGAFPGLKAVGDELVAKPNVREIIRQIGRTSGADRQRYLDEHYYPFTDRAEELGLDLDGQAGYYLSLRLWEAHPNLYTNYYPPVSHDELAEMVEADRNAEGKIVDQLRVDAGSLKDARTQATLSYDDYLAATIGTQAPGREAQFAAAFKNTDFAKEVYEANRYPFVTGLAKAQLACKDGGSKSIRLTTKAGELPTDPPGESSAELSPGAIAGIVIAVLVAVIAAVAVAIPGLSPLIQSVRLRA